MIIQIDPINKALPCSDPTRARFAIPPLNA